MKIAVVGAGMAGLTCARALAQRGGDVVVFDKGRGLGGRMATRRTDDGYQFDHGVQYLSARSDGFAAMLAEAEAADAIARWTPDHHDPARVGVPGMTGLAKYLAHGLQVRKGTRIARIVKAADRWKLVWDGGTDVFDRVVVTVPAPQVAPLLGDDPLFIDPLATVGMDPCLILMLGLPNGVELPFRSRRAPEDALSWIAVDSSKPGRPDRISVVAQASREWSQHHLELDSDRIADHMLPLVSDALGTDVAKFARYVSAHRWRYAFVSTPLGRPFLCDPEQTLFAGGDWCLGAKAEDAWSSGRAIAERIAKDI